MRCIDFHVHLPGEGFLRTLRPLLPGLQAYFHTKVTKKSLSMVVDEFEAAGVDKLVVLPLDAQRITGVVGDTDKSMYEAQKRYPDRLLCFAGVHKSLGEEAARRLRKSVSELQLKGVKVHPQLLGIYPNNRRLWPIYEEAQALNIPVVIHTGTTGIGAGMPGGARIRLDHGNPIHIDEIAASFPDLRIVCAHFGWPWHEQLLATAMHKPNVYLDISGWAPKYLPDTLIRYMNTILQDKFIFGTDYPMLSPKRCLAELEKIPLKIEVREKLMYKNAARVLRL